jgi:hypothetical protein
MQTQFWISQNLKTEQQVVTSDFFVEKDSHGREISTFTISNGNKCKWKGRSIDEFYDFHVYTCRTTDQSYNPSD